MRALKGWPVSVLSDDLQTLSYEAALYLYPLVLMDITRLQALNKPVGSSPIAGSPNQFHHVREFPSADFRGVVRPNFDTLYSSAWLDLTAGPVIVHGPNTDDRYYMLPMLDMWTDVFANPGKRTTGTAAQDFIVTPPHYAGELPADLPVISAPTPHVWVIGRTQTNGPADYPDVHKIQDGLGITVLAKDPRQVPGQVVDAGYDTTSEPLRLVNGMDPLDFFGYAADLLAINRPHPTDFSMLARVSGLGIVAGKPFSPDEFDARQRSEIAAGWAAALHDIMTSLGTVGARVNGWTIIRDNMGVYGNAYFQRALVALVGLGANPPEDAVYPLLIADADGDPVTGDHNYVLHFDAGELPPVAGFWSVTMYDGEGYQVANEINRFAIGDRDQLTFNADGSLDIYLQRTNPGPERVSNWLPAPDGPLGVTMRLYAPKRSVLDGSWSPPPVRKSHR
jgi:hypothetical protein